MKSLNHALAPLVEKGVLETALFHPDFGLFLFLADPVDWQAARTAWQAVQPAPQPLTAAPSSTMLTFLQLHPTIAAALDGDQSKLLLGKRPFSSLPAPNAQTRLAQQSLAAMQASQALLPTLLASESAKMAAQQLATLSNAPEKTAVAQFAILQLELQAQLAALPPSPPLMLPTADTAQTSPPALPTLRAIYRHEHGETIFVFDPLDLDVLAALNWRGLAEDLQKRSGGLQLTTPQQLRLAVVQQRPLDIILRRLKLEWGIDYLAGLEAEKTAAFHNAAQLPAQIYAQEFAPTFLNASAEQDAKLIHDYQNKLFNVRLVGELLFRSLNRPAPTPPALPGREAPASQRLNAIFDQLQWWLTHFLSS